MELGLFNFDLEILWVMFLLGWKVLVFKFGLLFFWFFGVFGLYVFGLLVFWFFDILSLFVFGFCIFCIFLLDLSWFLDFVIGMLSLESFFIDFNWFILICKLLGFSFLFEGFKYFLLEWLDLFLRGILDFDLLVLLEFIFCFGIDFCIFELFEVFDGMGVKKECFLKGVLFCIVIWLGGVGLNFLIFLILVDVGVGVSVGICGVGCFRICMCCWGLGFLKMKVVYKFVKEYGLFIINFCIFV